MKILRLDPSGIFTYIDMMAPQIPSHKITFTIKVGTCRVKPLVITIYHDPINIDSLNLQFGLSHRINTSAQRIIRKYTEQDIPIYGSVYLLGTTIKNNGLFIPEPLIKISKGVQEHLLE